ncbi:lactose-binding lectin l-2-like isoform X2 [Babylonia areolata]|uniref:lactose-binding lectin l-2-like isoform X2 n=1 Tax=Babylonia areolata TaxID=304850 RepID=UPI003FD0876C
MAVPSVFCAVVILCLGVVRVTGGRCPTGWSPYEDEFCFLLRKETYNWFDATSVCRTMGAYLAEDTSDSRHTFLNDLVHSHGFTSNYTWIGLQDFAEENVFVWSHSGRRAYPTFWGPSEPQDKGGEEDCVALHTGGWIDNNCEDGRGHFICEKPYT